MASRSSSGIVAILKRLPKAHSITMGATALLAACSLAFFAFAIPPMLSSQAIGSAEGITPVTEEASTAFVEDADDVSGGFSILSGSLAPIGASSFGGANGGGSPNVTDATDSAGPSSVFAGTDPSSPGQTEPSTPQAPGEQGSTSTPSVTPGKTDEEINAARIKIQDSCYNNAQNYYAELSNLVAGSPIFWEYDPRFGNQNAENWVDLQKAYAVCSDAQRAASQQDHELNLLAAEYPELARECQTVRQMWSNISSAANLFSRFLGTMQACPDPSTHSDCFMSLVRPHIVAVKSGYDTVYTLDYLENARQNMSSL